MAERDVLRGVNDQLNASIRAVSEALERGAADPSLLNESRRQAEAGIASLRDLAASGGPMQSGARSTMQHLDILISLIDSVEAAPDLSRKLAAHLLEEQASAPATARAGSGSLPGGRQPFTVGSLIGR